MFDDRAGNVLFECAPEKSETLAFDYTLQIIRDFSEYIQIAKLIWSLALSRSWIWISLLSF
jgi:hypothetical protein